MKTRLHSLLRPLLQVHCSSGRSMAFTMQHQTPPVARHSSGDATQYVLESQYPAFPPPTTGIVQRMLEKCKPHSQRLALVDGLTGRSVTFGTFIDWTLRWGALVQRRTRQGTAPPTVAIYMFNSPDYPAIFFGSMAAGAVVTTINPAYTAEEVVRQLQDSGAELLVVDADSEDTGLLALQLIRQRQRQESAAPHTVEMFVCGQSSSGHTDIRSLLEDPTAALNDPVEVDPESVGFLPYSSGTTGRPKGVCVKHSAVLSCLDMLNSEHFFEHRAGGEPDVMLGLLPFYHIYGIQCIMTLALSLGTEIITLPGFTPTSFTNSIKKHRPSLLPTVPPLLKFLIESSEVTSESLSQCRIVMCGAAPVSKSSADKFQRKTGGDIRFQEGYGMTEILISHATPWNEPKTGYCGKLLPGVRAKVVSVETGEALPPGQKGELLVQTPCMMAGYHNNLEATKETIDEQGWLHTGDIAIYEENGLFSIVDRIKELIKVKGFQVAPSEVEDILLKHPAVADAGVVGIPHDRFGEVPRAYIVKSKNQNVSEEELNNYLKSHLSLHKQLVGGIKFVTGLPKNPTGKLLRRVLKEMAEKET